MPIRNRQCGFRWQTAKFLNIAISWNMIETLLMCVEVLDTGSLKCPLSILSSLTSDRNRQRSRPKWPSGSSSALWPFWFYPSRVRQFRVSEYPPQDLVSGPECREFPASSSSIRLTSNRREICVRSMLRRVRITLDMQAGRSRSPILPNGSVEQPKTLTAPFLLAMRPALKPGIILEHSTSVELRPEER